MGTAFDLWTLESSNEKTNPNLFCTLPTHPRFPVKDGPRDRTLLHPSSEPVPTLQPYRRDSPTPALRPPRTNYTKTGTHAHVPRFDPESHVSRAHTLKFQTVPPTRDPFPSS